ncbi:MAG: hypothetical protein V4530_06035 [Pseudomonadota bacterium]
MKCLGFMVAAALALSGCGASLAPLSAGSVVATADHVVLSGQRAFGAAEVVYTAAAKLSGVAADRGLITGATATRVRGWNAEARDLLIRGKATSDAAEKARAAARLFDISDSLNAITGAK